MNDAMEQTVAMVVDGAKACGLGRETLVREDYRRVTIFVNQVFEGRKTSMGGVTVYESGRWEEFRHGESSARMFIESIDLAALRFRRAA